MSLARTSFSIRRTPVDSADEWIAESRAEILREARTWIGTPYREQGHMKGTGADCIGLFRGIAENLELYDMATALEAFEPFAAYSRFPNPTKLRAGLAAFFVKIDFAEVLVADILIFRGKQFPQHMAMATDRGLLHCLERHGVVEHIMDEDWFGRFLAAYRFPVLVT